MKKDKKALFDLNLLHFSVVDFLFSAHIIVFPTKKKQWKIFPSLNILFEALHIITRAEMASKHARKERRKQAKKATSSFFF